MLHVRTAVDPLQSSVRVGMRTSGRGPEFGNCNLVLKVLCSLLKVLCSLLKVLFSLH